MPHRRATTRGYPEGVVLRIVTRTAATVLAVLLAAWLVSLAWPVSWQARNGGGIALVHHRMYIWVREPWMPDAAWQLRLEYRDQGSLDRPRWGDAWVHLPLSIPAAAASTVLAASWLASTRARRRQIGAGICPSCAYDLTGLTGPCPECGHAHAHPRGGEQ